MPSSGDVFRMDVTLVGKFVFRDATHQVRTLDADLERFKKPHHGEEAGSGEEAAAGSEEEPAKTPPDDLEKRPTESREEAARSGEEVARPGEAQAWTQPDDLEKKPDVAVIAVGG